MKKFISKIVPKPKLPKIAAPNLPKLPIPKFEIPGLGLGKDLISFVGNTLDSGIGLVTGSFASIPFFGTTQSDDYDHRKFDEKHYFLIPTPDTEPGFAVHIIRSLPKGVPPINDLPKQRLVHLPNVHALPMLTDMMVKSAKEQAETNLDSNFLSRNLDGFVDEIDRIDAKLFSGSLLVGGLVALVNPLAGGAIAMKSMMPAVGVTLSKYGLKFASETISNMDAANQIKKAEKDVLAQFKSGQTIQIINPLLANMSQSENSDPILEFECQDYDIPHTDNIRLLELTQQATINVHGPDISEHVTRLSRLILSDV